MTAKPRVPATGLPHWRRTADLAVGKGQLRALGGVLRRASGLARGRATTSQGHVDYLVRQAGTRIPIVMVHGFAGDKETWLLTAPWISRRHPLLALDLPGHGSSSRPCTDTGAEVTPAFYARAIADVMTSCGWASAVIVGNSLGGGVALRLAVDAPERVAGLVLLDSVGPDAHRSRTARAWAAGGNPLIPASAEAADEMVARNLHRAPPVPRSMIRYIAHRRATNGAHLQALFRHFVHASPHEGIPADLSRVAAPTLVVHGLRDQVISVATAHQLAAGIPKARLRLLSEVGHSPQLEAPRMIAAMIAQFCAGLDGGNK